MQDNLFEIKYDAKGTSVKTNALGMRDMQNRVYQRRNSKYLLVKAPPASGKSRALMFVALDKLKNQGLNKVIIAVPERSIGKSFRSTNLSENGFYWDWYVKPENNLTIKGTNKSTVKQFVNFMRSTDPSDDILISTHATLRFAFEKLDDSEFDNILLAIDEFHHVSRDDNSVLGNALRSVLMHSDAHILAMTGSYFRGDEAAILEPADEAKFDKVTYTYYEQLEGYQYLESFAMGYSFYRGKYIDALDDVIDTDKKTIIHIPSVNSGESTKEKYDEVHRIFDAIGEYESIDENNIHHIRTQDGKLLKIADLVTENGRDKVSAYLDNMNDIDDLDMIIALGMAKEGFDWPFAEYALTIGYRNSLTEVVQIIGRVTRDSSNKTHVQFTNLLAMPDAQDGEVQYAINNIMKAITSSLLMEQVLAPVYKFKPKDSDEQQSEGADIYIKGLAAPSTDRSKQIIEQDLNDLKASILQDSTIQAAIATGADAKVINKQLIPRIISTIYPDLNSLESEEVRQHLVADMVLKTSEKDADNQKIIKMADKFINIDDLAIDLIDAVNPFQRAYEIISKDIDSTTLRLIQSEFDGKRFDFSEADILVLYPQIKQFRAANNGRFPERTSHDESEQRLAYALAKIIELKKEHDGQV
jgi:superfamily II DNA or RNA helicase/transcriptional regulator NrdR family protein